MEKGEKTKMTIEMEVTSAQALTLKAMFNTWSRLGNIGSSRQVSFFVDGDGDFHPNCKITIEKEIPELTEEIEKIACVKQNDDGYWFDYDNVAWKIYHDHD